MKAVLAYHATGERAAFVPADNRASAVYRREHLIQDLIAAVGKEKGKCRSVGVGSLDGGRIPVLPTLYNRRAANVKSTRWRESKNRATCSRIVIHDRIWTRRSRIYHNNEYSCRRGNDPRMKRGVVRVTGVVCW